MSKRNSFLVAVVIAIAIAPACSDDSSGDGGNDATSEPIVDLCDLGSFTGNGNACPHASTRICFTICEASDPGGCICKDSTSGPKWVCTYPDDCKDPCGNTSPENDADCPDANEAGVLDGDLSDATDAGDATDAASE